MYLPLLIFLCDHFDMLSACFAVIALECGIIISDIVPKLVVSIKAIIDDEVFLHLWFIGTAILSPTERMRIKLRMQLSMLAQYASLSG